MTVKTARISSLVLPPAVSAYAELARLPQAIVVILGTIVGAHFAQLSLPFAAIVTVGLANACLFIAAVALNDWTDVLEDSIDKPDRPIPSGRIDASSALVFAASSTVLGIGMSAWVSWQLGVAATAIGFFSAFYSLRLKGIPFLGNAIVATVSTYPLWCWIVVDGHLDTTFVYLMLACFLFRTGAELIKTAEDHVGDRCAGRRTVATEAGVRFANRAGSGLFGRRRIDNLPLAGRDRADGKLLNTQIADILHAGTDPLGLALRKTGLNGLDQGVHNDPNRLHRIVIARDGILDQTRIGIRIHDGHHRNLDPLGFGHRNVLKVHIDHEHD